MIFQNIDARFFYKIKISKLFKIFRFILYFDILYFQNELSVQVNFSTSTLQSCDKKYVIKVDSKKNTGQFFPLYIANSSEEAM